MFSIFEHNKSLIVLKPALSCTSYASDQTLSGLSLLSDSGWTLCAPDILRVVPANTIQMKE